MKISSSANSSQQCSFGAITTDTIRRANARCIKEGEKAKELGMKFEDYLNMRNESGEFNVRLGKKTYNTYELANNIVSDEAKLREAFGKAWDKYARPFIKETTDRVMRNLNK